VRTEGLSILAALALHVGVVLVARGMPPLTLLSSADRQDLRVIDIDIPATPAVEMQVPQLPQNLEPPTPRPDDHTPVGRGGSAYPGPQALPNPESTAEPSANPAPASTEKPRFDALPSDDPRGVLGLQGVPGLGSPVWGMPGVLQAPGAAPPAPTVAPAPRQVDRDIAGQVIREALTTRDKDMGIDQVAGGSVASAVRVAVQGSDVPLVAHGRIECRIGAAGNVIGCRAVSMNGGDADQWNRAAQAAQAALAGRALTLTGDFTNGATVTVDVTSNNQPPAGSKGGFSGTGASFDISNIGGHNTRHVRTSFSVSAAR